MASQAIPPKIQTPKRLKLNGWGGNMPSKTKQKEAGSAMLMSNQIDFLKFLQIRCNLHRVKSTLFRGTV